ncbi:MAG: DUF2325 domain-containing protein [Bacillota bacterium]
MSIVLLGGHDRMKREYEKMGEKLGHKVKVYTQMTPKMEKNIGCPDCILVFTDVISHKIVYAALKVSKSKKIPLLRSHNSSMNGFISLITQLETLKNGG